MQKIISAFIIALILTAFTYFIGNKNQCCDQIFRAGWPFPFYGGSGGFAGIRENTIIYIGLVIDVVFWFVISYLVVSFALKFKK